MLLLYSWLALAQIAWAQEDASECNASACPTSWLGDGWCDEACNIEPCGFDQGADGINDCAEECLQLADQGGCNEDLLENDECDEEWNSFECGYDQGRWGYCAKYCFQTILGNGTCNTVCNTQQCYYDKNDWGWCAEDCFQAMLGDGNCDSVCNVEGCDGDEGDCSGCADGCYDFMRNDGNCDEVCKVQECGWDGSDCYCASGCRDEQSQNDICDDECNNAACNFDNGLCGDCANGCFTADTQNDACDTAWNNVQCDYDNGKCGCYPGCTNIAGDAANNFGICENICMYYTCGYDYESESNGCNILGKRTAAFYNHMINWNMDRELDIEAWENQQANNGCTLDKLVNAFENKICYSECNDHNCMYSMGACNSTWDDDCNICYDGGCLECAEGTYQFFTVCLTQASQCPSHSFELQTLFGRQVCVPKIDDTTPENPETLYVKMVDYGDNNGEANNPFWTLELAMTTLSRNYNRIYLLKDDKGSADFVVNAVNTQDERSSNNRDVHQPLLYNNSYTPLKLELKPFYCSQHVTLEGCFDEGEDASILLESNPALHFSLANTVEISNIVFNGRFILDNECTESGDWCYYCPYVTFDQVTQSYRNDRNEQITETQYPDQQTKCIDEHGSRTFIEVQENAQIYFTNVTFKNFRAQVHAIINSNGGTFYWTNVYFENNQVKANDNYSAIISQDDKACENDADNLPYGCGALIWLGGHVKYTNPGYKYDPTLTLGSFMHIDVMAEVRIQDVTFEKNMMVHSTTDAFSGLIKVERIKKFQFQGCKFQDNIVKQGLWVGPPQSWEIQTNITDSQPVDHQLTHIQFVDVTFKGNSAIENLIKGEYPGDIHNWEFKNVVFDNNVVYGEMIEVKKATVLKTEHKVEESRPVVDGDLRQTITFPPRWFNLLQLSFTDNYVQGLFSISGMANVYIDNCEMLRNGESNIGITPDNTTLQVFIDDADHYMTTLPDVPFANVTVSQTLSLVEAGYNATIANSVYRENYADSKNVGLSFTEETLGQVSVQSVTFADNIGGSTEFGIGFYMDTTSPIAINDFTATNNNDPNELASGPLFLYSSGKGVNATITSSTFTDNTCGKGGGMNIYEFFNVQLSTVTFTNNEDKTYGGGAIHLEAGVIDGTILMNAWTFDGNRADKNRAQGGAIFIATSTAVYDLQIQNSQFISNQAGDGTIRISDQVSLSSNSYVRNWEFTGNVNANAGVFDNQARQGILEISNCQFTSNVATIGSVLYAAHGPDDESKSDSRSIVKLDSCTFLDNQGDAMIYLYDTATFSSLETKHWEFTQNQGPTVLILYGNYKDIGSTFSQNIGNNGCALEVTENGEARLQYTIFSQNDSTEYGGAMSISSASWVAADHCIFSQNRATNKGGAIFMEQNSNFQADNCTFTENYTGDKGSAMFILGSQQKSQINNSKFERNIADNSATILLLDSSLEIVATEMKDNTASLTPGISLNLSTIKIQDSTFSNHTCRQGCFIHATTESQATIRGGSMTGATAVGSGGSIYAISSVITIEGTSIKSTKANLGGCIAANSESQLAMRDVTVEGSEAIEAGGVVNTFETIVTIEDSHFKNFLRGGFVGDKVVELNLNNVIIEEGEYDFGGCLYCSRCSVVNIQKSTFQYCNATIAGGIYLGTRTDTAIAATYTLTNNTIAHNIAEEGGGLFTDNIKINITETLFNNNTAIGNVDFDVLNLIYGKGGGAVFACTAQSDCFFNLLRNKWHNNTAYANGGAISWNDIKPNNTDSEYINNTAAYAGNESSFPVTLVAVDEDGTFMAASNETRRLEDIPVATSVTSVASGQDEGRTLRIALVDHNGEICATQQTAEGELVPVDPTKVTLSGQTKATAVNGIFNFVDFEISADPGTQIELYVQTDAVDSTKAEKAQDNYSYNSQVLIDVELRECIVGEALVGQDCEPCISGQYSIEAGQDCHECPSEAICYGNNTMVPRSGYWRASKETDVFFSCPNTVACTGSPEPPENLSWTGECETGYKGNLCQSCEEGYSSASKNQCAICPEEDINALRLTGIMIAVIIFAVILVKTTMNSAYRPAKLHSVYLKIFMNYLQLVMLTASFNLDWPEQVLELFSVQDQAGSVSDHIFSVDCFLERDDGDTDQNKEQVYYDKLVLMAFLPVFVLIAATAFWGIYSWYSKAWHHMKDELISTIVILLFLVHPNIVKIMFSVFSCQEIEPGEFWIITNLDIPCWSSNHITYVLAVAIPSIFLWGLGIPSACLIALYKSRKTLHTLSTRLRFGFLFNGYEDHTYFWELIILYRKMLVICCAVFLGNISIPVQALTVMMLLIASLYLQGKFNPFMNSDLNECETRSILVSAVTIYCGLFYLTGHLNNATRFLFFILITVVNAYFLLYWASKMFGAGIGLVIQGVPCLKRRFGYINKVKDGFEGDMLVNKHINGHFQIKGKEAVYSIAPLDYRTLEKNDYTILPAKDMQDLYMQTVRYKLSHGIRQTRRNTIFPTMKTVKLPTMEIEQSESEEPSPLFSPTQIEQEEVMGRFPSRLGTSYSVLERTEEEPIEETSLNDTETEEKASIVPTLQPTDEKLPPTLETPQDASCPIEAEQDEECPIEAEPEEKNSEASIRLQPTMSNQEPTASHTAAEMSPAQAENEQEKNSIAASGQQSTIDNQEATASQTLFEMSPLEEGKEEINEKD